jgi:hypothetical protein
MHFCRRSALYEIEAMIEGFYPRLCLKGFLLTLFARTICLIITHTDVTESRFQQKPISMISIERPGEKEQQKAYISVRYSEASYVNPSLHDGRNFETIIISPVCYFIACIALYPYHKVYSITMSFL